jgi:hypothetical protein
MDLPLSWYTFKMFCMFCSICFLKLLCTNHTRSFKIIDLSGLRDS